LAALAAAVLATPGAGQAGFAARLSADTVEVGEVFALLVRVPVPAGSVVHFPDTVARTDFLESHSRVRWQADADGSGGAVLTLEYPVMAFGVALVPVPGFDVLVGPAPQGAQGAPLPGGSLVGTWDDASTRGEAALRPLRVPRRGVWVNPVFTPELMEAGVEPRASADVLGSSWHWPSVLVGLVFAGALVVLLVSATRDWRRRRKAEPSALGARWTLESSRRRALEELARLTDEGLATSGRVQELYTRSSGIVRTHAARVSSEYGPDLTSTELMSRLEHARQVAASAQLSTEMRTAEVVKFGRLRPASEAAVEHLHSLRAWLER
jgi:hypothetical protein